MKYLAAAVSIALVTNVLSDGERFVRAWQQWKRDPSPGSLFHLVTSGYFLAEDAAALGLRRE